MSTQVPSPAQVPRLLGGLVDDAAVFPPGNASLPDAVAAHRRHRAAWYADLVGPLLVPASALPDLAALLGVDERIEVGVIGAAPTAQGSDPRIRVRQVEVAVAKRGEDPLPGLADLVALGRRLDGIDCYAEIPLTWGLSGALDLVAEARAAGTRIAAKFRTGGLAAELFPTSPDLAAVICACRDRGLPFKLTAGLHHAARHIDPETGFTHHGFVNVLAATIAAAGGADPGELVALLSATDPVPLAERVRAQRDQGRPLWIGFGSCSIQEPLADLIRLGLVSGAPDHDQRSEETS